MYCFSLSVIIILFQDRDRPLGCTCGPEVPYHDRHPTVHNCKYSLNMSTTLLHQVLGRRKVVIKELTRTFGQWYALHSMNLTVF